MSEARTPRLTKSQFMRGEQCTYAMWREEHEPHLASAPDDMALDLAEQAAEVEAYARNLYRAGAREIQFAAMTHAEAASETLREMDDPYVEVIYNATFLVDEKPFRTNMIRRDGAGGWEVMLIHSSTEVKPEHIPDLAFQVYALRSAGIRVDRAFVVHLDGSYEFDGHAIDPWSLFKWADVSEEVLNELSHVAVHAERRLAVLQSPVAPIAEVGSHCKKPVECPFKGACHDLLPHLPLAVDGYEEPVKIPVQISNLYRHRAGTKRDYLYQLNGITRIDEIPEDAAMLRLPEDINAKERKAYLKALELSAYQKRQWQAVRTLEPQIDQAALDEALSPLLGGFHNLDFECASYAIPRYRGTRPFEQILQQFSISSIYADGGYEWRDYVDDGIVDPRRPTLERMLDFLERDALPIIVYSSYEQTTTESLKETYPDLAERISAVQDRFVDLLKVIEKGYYHPAFKGRFSEKYTLPALVPGLDHSDLEIRNGAAACRWLRSLTNPGLPAESREAIHASLRVYNKRDTDGTAALALALYGPLREMVAQRFPALRERVRAADFLNMVSQESGIRLVPR